jgi:hypothetical protein
MLEPLRVRFHRAGLVGELADGVAPTTSLRHWRSAEQLLVREHRQQLALGLERLIEASEHPRPAFSSAVPPQRRQVREARTMLWAIARVLRSPEPVGVQGVAIVARLLVDGAGPAFAPAPPGTLAALAEQALDALCAPSTASELAAPA